MNPSIFDYKDIATWKDQLLRSSLKVLSLTELEDQNRPIADREYEVISKVFWQEYGYLRIFHASKPENPATVHQQGLKIFTSADLLKSFQQRFSEELSGYSEAALVELAQQLGKRTETPGIYFPVDDRPILESAGHYLIYGSEFHWNLAANFPSRIGVRIRNKLKNRGCPTMFRVQIPVSLVSDVELFYLAKELVLIWRWNQGDFDEAPERLNHSIFLTEPVPSNLILSHDHPDKVPNPFSGAWGHEETYVRANRCPMCETGLENSLPH